MPTYLPATGSISFSQIKSAFSNNKNSLSQYRSLRWYKNTGTTSPSYPAGWYGNFSNTTIRFSDFYAKGDDITVPNGSPSTVTTNTTFTIGAFHTLSIYLVSGYGGSGGANGTYVGGPSNGQATTGSSGANGGNTTLSGAITASASGSSPSTGGAAATAGTANTVLVGTYTLASNINLIGQSVTLTCGTGGAGGAGGIVYAYNPTLGYYDSGSKGATGANGAGGGLYAVWS